MSWYNPYGLMANGTAKYEAVVLWFEVRTYRGLDADLRLTCFDFKIAC